jgi:hypothetical protein
MLKNRSVIDKIVEYEYTLVGDERGRPWVQTKILRAEHFRKREKCDEKTPHNNYFCYHSIAAVSELRDA